MNVTGNENVQAAVTVVVAKAWACGPVAERNAGSFGHVGKCSVVVVVVQPVFAVVSDVEVGPAIVVVIADRAAESPSVIRHARDVGNVGESSVMIIMEERGMRRLGFAVQRVECRTIHKVDVEPAVVVVVKKADAGSDRFQDKILLRRAHLVLPHSQAGFFRDVLKDDRAILDEAARGDGALL